MHIKKEPQFVLGLTLILIGLGILMIYFFPILTLEGKYRLKTEVKEELQFSPIDQNFSIIIPKIEINSKVIPDIDPYDQKEYSKALSQSVAHAKGSAYPDSDGNVFIFAHSTNSPVNVSRYNAIFYLLDKLDVGEKIYIVYHGKRYQYQVKEKKIIDPSDVSLLENSQNDNILTLMTCWPAGTTLKRLLVISQKL